MGCSVPANYHGRVSGILGIVKGPVQVCRDVVEK